MGHCGNIYLKGVRHLVNIRPVISFLLKFAEIVIENLYLKFDRFVDLYTT